MRSRKKASRRVRHELGQDVPDSGQEHLAHSDNGFLVTTTSLDAAIAFSKFRMLSGMDERVGHLNQKRFQVRACTGNASGRLNPKFCVNSQRGENRSEFIVRGSGFIRLPLVCSITPAGMDVKGGGKAAVHRSAVQRRADP